MNTVWAISDTHLSFAKPRDQTRFGETWRNHTDRIKTAWQARVAPDDVVLLAGDLSWAHSPKHVQPDVDWIATLPGHKVLIRGNHDYWWKKLGQVGKILHDARLYAVQGSCLALNGVLVCGTMGHIAPNDPYYQKHKYSSYLRELNWLTAALEAAHAQRTRKKEPILLMVHYPPFTSNGKASGFTEVIQKYKPDICVYGHLHFEHEWQVAVTDNRNGTQYHLVTSDYLDMIPRQVWPPQR